MALLKHLFLLLPLLARTSAQDEDYLGDKVWAAVAFINNGERTPFMGNDRTILTPEGAQQMMRQGTTFRARYLPDSVKNPAFADVAESLIQNMDVDMIDNEHLNILAHTDEWVSAGAMAFMQGFYPSSREAFEESAGGKDISRDYTEDGNMTDYPLNGYQYPNIRTVSLYDPNSAALQGTARCAAWQTEIKTNFTRQTELDDLFESTYSFYQRLFSTHPLEGAITLDQAHFYNAYEIYDYVDYMYKHNKTVHDDLENAGTTLALLNSYAVTVSRAKNSYLERTSSGDPNPIDVLYSIAGRTLAYKVADQFMSNVRWQGQRDKLTLMFGSFEPIMSFISLSGLLNQVNIFKGPFATIPAPGAALVFELYGENSDNPGKQPDLEDLAVRVYYRADSNPGTGFVVQPLFDSGASGRISYQTFYKGMQNIGRTAEEWCDVCGSATAPWCAVINSTKDSDLEHTSLSAGVAGIVGGIIMLCIVVVLFTLFYFFGGLRVIRQTKSEGSPQTVNAAGGFKGPEKKVGDADVVVTDRGIHHERVGSWELREGRDVMPQTAGIVTSDFNRRDRQSLDSDGDGISVMGATPVKARESV